jgi:hypothetical protein
MIEKNELRSPLLVGLHRVNEVIDEDEEVHHIKVYLRDGDDYEDDGNEMDDDDDDDHHLLISDEVMIFLVLPCLMFSQFGMAFLMHDESTTHLSWSIVNFSIFLYWVTAWLYQHACLDSKIETVLVVLLPEILMDVILVIVWLDQVQVGLFVLLVSVIALSALAFAMTAKELCFSSRKEQQLQQQLQHQYQRANKNDDTVPKQRNLQEIQAY